MNIEITKIGNRCKIAISGEDEVFYPDLKNVDIGFNSATDEISLFFKCNGGVYEYAMAMANATLEGEVITSQQVFDTQMAVLFPNVNSGSGGSGMSADLQTASDDAAAFTALSDSEWGVFLVTGQDPSIYAKDATGNQFKLTLPTY